MAKVILLNSSPRANSNTQDVLEVCAEEIEKNGVEAEIISLRGKQIQSCIREDKQPFLKKCERIYEPRRDA